MLKNTPKIHTSAKDTKISMKKMNVLIYQVTRFACDNKDISLVHLVFSIKQLARNCFVIGLTSNDFSYLGKNNLSHKFSLFAFHIFLVQQ